MYFYAKHFRLGLLEFIDRTLRLLDFDVMNPEKADGLCGA